MRSPAILLIAFVAIASASASAAPPAAAPQASEKLRTALRTMLATAAQANPPGQSKRPIDPDQGDDNASLRAIQEVCSHGNPSATRSAICPTPVSPF